MPKRIAFIGSYAPSLLDFKGSLFVDLISLGHTIYVFVPDISSDLNSRLVDLGIIPISLSFSRSSSILGDLRAFHFLAISLRSLSIDICVTFFLKPNILGVFAAKIAAVDKIVTLVEGLGYFYTQRPEHDSLKLSFTRLFVSFLYRISLRLSSRNIFLNRDDLYQFTSSRISPLQSSTVVLGTGIDSQKWPALPPIIDPISFLFVGRLLEDKGIREFLMAAKIVHQLRPSASFHVLGDFDDNPKSLTRTNSLVVESCSFVNFHGHSDVRYWLSQSSVFVLPSYREGLPRSTQEALSSGKPVITTDVPGCRDTVIDSYNGFLVAPFSSRALVSPMLKFIDNPSLVTSMGVNSRFLALNLFDSSVINPQIISHLIE
jgi:glycosyltransferase involved in cell wall biosynthesis